MVDEFPFDQKGDVPQTKALTIMWGLDLPDGRRVDYYCTFEGDYYKRTIPAGGSFVPELQGSKPGFEPVWEKVPFVPPTPTRFLP